MVQGSGSLRPAIKALDTIFFKRVVSVLCLHLEVDVALLESSMLKLFSMEHSGCAAAIKLQPTYVASEWSWLSPAQSRTAARRPAEAAAI